MMQKIRAESKYFTTADYNKFTNQTLDAKIKQNNQLINLLFAGFTNNANLNKKIATLAIKAELKEEQDKITKLQAFDLIYFRGKSHFEDDDIQNYLVFHPTQR